MMEDRLHDSVLLPTKEKNLYLLLRLLCPLDQVSKLHRSESLVERAPWE